MILYIESYILKYEIETEIAICQNHNDGLKQLQCLLVLGCYGVKSPEILRSGPPEMLNIFRSLA